MPNITLALPADVLRAARIRAAEQGTSVSGLVRDYLASLAGLDDEFARLVRLQDEVLAEVEGFSAADRLSRDALHDRAARRQEAAEQAAEAGGEVR